MQVTQFHDAQICKKETQKLMLLFPLRKSKGGIQAIPIATEPNPLHDIRSTTLNSQNLPAENNVGFQNQVFGLAPFIFKVRSL